AIPPSPPNRVSSPCNFTSRLIAFVVGRGGDPPAGQAGEGGVYAGPSLPDQPHARGVGPCCAGLEGRGTGPGNVGPPPGVGPILFHTSETIPMKQHLLAALGLLGCSPLCSAVEFAPPVRLKADGVVIRVESPGYASPCLADIDGDGKLDLL